MNYMKDKLDAELHSVVLSSEKKTEMVRRIKRKSQKRQQTGKWQYRTVLTSFVLLAISFSYSSWISQDRVAQNNSASPDIEKSMSIMSILQHDAVKTAILVFLFLTLYGALRKSNRGLPVCIHCGEVWTRKESLKFAMKNGEITCPNCQAKQFKTRRASKQLAVFHFLIPFMILVANLFSHALLGVGLYLLCVILLFINVAPYYMEVQEEDPTNEPFW